ncbi:MAG: 3-isopropylmalate dehydrogenase [Candidatus Fimivivens sp.]
MAVKKITVLQGDGIGPEITAQGVLALQAVAKKFGHTFEFTFSDFGGYAIDRHGEPFPTATRKSCESADAILLGSVGGPKWEGVPKEVRPEKGLLQMRAALGLFANLRPAKLHAQLAHACPLKPEIISQGIDIMIVRELTGGIYFGTHETTVENGQRVARDVLVYSQQEIDRILHVGFEAAKKRGKKLASVEKSNVLDSSRLWKERAHAIAAEYKDVALSDILVDNAAMQLVRNPAQFDVIVTENMFGDILSDEASQIVGSIGMMPSASLRSDSFGVYEPIHGSAPDIAGKDIANPIGTILSAAMLLRYSFDMNKEADAIESAVESVLNKGLRTSDIMSAGCTKIGCHEMGRYIAAEIAI